MNVTFTSLWPARIAAAVGLLIPGFWLVTLWDFLRGQGPSPGAGAQYVFIFMPTMASAMILLGVSAAVHLQLLSRQPLARRPVNWIVMTVSGLAFLVLAAYWVAAALRAAAA